MRRFRFYMDTSFWLRLVDGKQHLKRAWTYDFLSRTVGRHKLLMSGLVLEELEGWPAKDRHIIGKKMERVRARILPSDDWAKRFARTLQILGAFHPSRVDDLTHVGSAVGGGVDALLTGDVNTLACDPVSLTCRRLGHPVPLTRLPSRRASTVLTGASSSAANALASDRLPARLGDATRAYGRSGSPGKPEDGRVDRRQ